MLGAGTLGFWFFDASPWLEVCAFLFGVGAGLTLDEFALWVYLDDVYWKEEGRASVDAAVLAVTFLGLVLIGIRPFDVEGGSFAEVAGGIASVVLSVIIALICLLKQRLWHGTVGLLVGPLGLYGALRLGKPGSAWARRRYGDRDPSKQARSEERFQPDRRTERLKRVVRDAVGGTPQEEYETKLAQRR